MPLPDNADHPTLYCTACGYALTGVCTADQPTGRCPECGAAFDRAELLRHGGVILPEATALKSLLIPPGLIGGVLLACGVLGVLDVAPSVFVILFSLTVLVITGAGFVWNTVNAWRLVQLARRRPVGQRIRFDTILVAAVMAGMLAVLQIALTFVAIFTALAALRVCKQIMNQIVGIPY